MMGFSEELAHPNQTKTSKVVELMQKGSAPLDGRLGSQKGTMQFNMKKGNQQHTNTPMITDKVFKTLVSLLKDILKELSGCWQSILFPFPVVFWQFLACTAALSKAEIRLICF